MADKARENHEAHKRPLHTLGLQTSATDYLVKALYEKARQQYGQRFPGGFVPHVIIAVGGYGRREMAPHSDVDLLFLVDSADSAFMEALVESILYPMWDLKLKVGYATRSPEEAFKWAREDFTVWTSMLDMRFLCGDQAFFAHFMEDFRRMLLGRQTEGFLREKWQELDQRRKRNGDTVFLLEPNVKEGAGGLRDLHTIEWSVRIRNQVAQMDWWQSLSQMAGFSPFEIGRLKRAQNFLWRVRAQLHYQENRCQDKLTLQAQDTIARNLGITANRNSTASEVLMGRYFAHARYLANITDELRLFFVTLPRHRKALYRITKRTIGSRFSASGGVLSLRSESNIEMQAATAIDMLRIAAESGQRISFHAARRIDALAASRVPGLFRLPEVRKSFLTLFESPKCGEALDLLHKHALLPRLLREFQHLWCRMQHDAFHSYTVDMHLVSCVKIVDKLIAELPDNAPPGFAQARQAIEDPALLRMAVLFHDIGKGYGHDHSEFGARLVRSIGKRYKIDPRITRRVARQVEIHLLLSNTAQRADINDPLVVRSFAQKIGDVRNLNILYLLTIADQLSVSSSILTDWKFRLMDRLYSHARNMLETGDTGGDWILQELQERRTSFADSCKRDDALSVLPLGFVNRYFLTYDEERIEEHARFLQQVDSQDSLVRIVPPGRGHSAEIWVFGEDYPGLFRNLCAQMYQSHINILQTDAFVSGDNELAFNIFHVHPEDSLFFENQKKLDALEKALNQALKADGKKLEVTVLDEKKLKTFQEISGRTDKVFWDDALTEDTVVLEVHTWDRFGLLFQLADTISTAGFNLAMAKIDTRGNRAYDVFYLTDREHKKPSDRAQLDLLCERLREQLTPVSDVRE